LITTKLLGRMKSLKFNKKYSIGERAVNCDMININLIRSMMRFVQVVTIDDQKNKPSSFTDCLPPGLISSKRFDYASQLKQFQTQKGV